jgi:hypothetical protein
MRNLTPKLAEAGRISATAFLVAVSTLIGGCATGPSDSGVLMPVYPASASCPEIANLYGAADNSPSGRRYGIDFFLDSGTPVLAISDGIVIDFNNGDFGGYDLYIQQKLNDKISGKFLISRYGRLQIKRPVRKGDLVKKGQLIGYVGTHSGRDYLHFGIILSSTGAYFHNAKGKTRVRGRFVDPLSIFPTANGKSTISYQTNDGSIYPSDAKVVWPAVCELSSKDMADFKVKSAPFIGKWIGTYGKFSRGHALTIKMQGGRFSAHYHVDRRGRSAAVDRKNVGARLKGDALRLSFADGAELSYKGAGSGTLVGTWSNGEETRSILLEKVQKNKSTFGADSAFWLPNEHSRKAKFTRMKYHGRR